MTTKARRSDTWFTLVHQALQECRGPAPLDAIYAIVEASPRTKDRAHWKAKVRQVLEAHDEFVRIEKGVWGLSSKYSAKAVKKMNRIRLKECPKRTQTD